MDKTPSIAGGLRPGAAVHGVGDCIGPGIAVTAYPFTPPFRQRADAQAPIWPGLAAWLILLVIPLNPAGVCAEQPAAARMPHWPAATILPPEPGRTACWRRVYDAKHLNAHPRQTVTELTFFLRVSGNDAGGSDVFKNPDHINYNFALSLKRRGDQHALATSGDCLGDKGADCVVDCDGGGVTIGTLPGGGLSIRPLVGGIAFGHSDETPGTWVMPGADDKVFHLDPAPVDACKSLEKTQLGGWDHTPER